MPNFSENFLANVVFPLHGTPKTKSALDLDLLPSMIILLYHTIFNCGKLIVYSVMRGEAGSVELIEDISVIQAKFNNSLNGGYGKAFDVVL